MLRAAQDAGCAAAEIGIPFSDPLADGPTVQRAGWQALRNGMTTALAIEQVAEARAAGVTIPLAFMTYINPVLSHGLERFCADARGGRRGRHHRAGPSRRRGGRAARRWRRRTGSRSSRWWRRRRRRRASSSPPATPAGSSTASGVVGTTGARDRIAAEAFDLLDRVRACTPAAAGHRFWPEPA